MNEVGNMELEGSRRRERGKEIDSEETNDPPLGGEKMESRKPP